MWFFWEKDKNEISENSEINTDLDVSSGLDSTELIKYEYTKYVNTDKLKDEILASNIKVALSHINTNEDFVEIYFKNKLSIEDKKILDSIIDLHDGTGYYRDILHVSLVEDLIFPKDKFTGNILVREKRYLGSLSILCVRFTTGMDTKSDSWQPPRNSQEWSIDVSKLGLTIIRFSPKYSYQIDGFGFRGMSSKFDFSNNIVIRRVVLSPYTVYEHSFLENYKLRDGFDSFERLSYPKFVKFTSDNPDVSVLQFDIEHDPDLKFPMQLWISIYKPTMTSSPH